MRCDVTAGARRRWMLLLAAALAAGACATVPQTVYRTGPKGEPVPYKRYAKHVAVDLIHRFRATAYRAAAGNDFTGHLSPEEDAVLAQWGQPEMLRRPFKSRGNELVREWAYLEQARVIQFIEGRVAFEGPLTDYEKTLIERGYPDRASEIVNDGGGEWVHWIYQNRMTMKGAEISFGGDKKIFEMEHQ